MCDPLTPCLGVLREILVASTFTITACGNGHHFRRETPWAGGVAVREVACWDHETQGVCLECGTPIETKVRGRPRAYCSNTCNVRALRRARGRGR